MISCLPICLSGSLVPSLSSFTGSIRHHRFNFRHSEFDAKDRFDVESCWLLGCKRQKKRLVKYGLRVSSVHVLYLFETTTLELTELNFLSQSTPTSSDVSSETTRPDVDCLLHAFRTRRLKMDELLRPVKAKITIVEEIKTGPDESPKLIAPIESPEDALQTLKESPSWTQVQEVLILLTKPANGDFNIKQPGALAAQLIQALVTQTLPDFWTMLKKEKSPAPTKSMFTAALFSVSGLVALLSRLKVLTVACSPSAKPGQRSFSPLQLRDLLEVLEEILRPETMFTALWSNCVLLCTTLPQRTVLWKEFVSLVASGKLMSSFAEAEDILKQSGEKHRSLWVSKGTDYTRWLARNISNMVKVANASEAESFSAVKTICSKALAIGYSGMTQTLQRVLLFANLSRCFG